VLYSQERSVPAKFPPRRRGRFQRLKHRIALIFLLILHFFELFPVRLPQFFSCLFPVPVIIVSGADIRFPFRIIIYPIQRLSVGNRGVVHFF
jgi:hypothetical protein